MGHQYSTREVPVADLKPMVVDALAAIKQWRKDKFEKYKKNRVEFVNNHWWHKLLRLKPYTLEQADAYLRADSAMGSSFGDLEFTFGRAEQHLKMLLSLCNKFTLKDHIYVTAEDAEILSQWAQ